MPARAFMADGGEAGAVMRAHDWAASPLGEPAAWPQPLKTLVEVMLTANQPMFVAWGPGRTLLYNDGYAAILADRHPGAMGRDVLEVWEEIRADLVPIFEEAYAGRPVHMDDIALVMHRRGRTEEAHFSFSYTPVHDEAGRVAGFFCACMETTGAVLAERRRVAERERLARMFDQAPGFMAMLSGPEHVFDLVNQAYLRLVGGRDVAGRPVREALPEVAGQGFFEVLDGVFASGERVVADAVPVRLRRAPSAAEEERILDFVYEPVRDGDGTVTGIFVEGQDVTERVRAEAELRAQAERQAVRLAFEERLRPLADPDAVIAEAVAFLGEQMGFDRVGYTEVVDNRTVRMTGSFVGNGMTPLVGDFPLDGFGEARITRQRQGLTEASDDVLTDAGQDAAVWAAIDTRSMVSVPLVRDGRLVASLYVNNRAPRPWTADEVSLIEEVAARGWDAVERARAQAATRDSEERFRAIVETARDYAIFTTDPEGRIETWPPGAEAVFGWSAEEATGRSVSILFTPEDRAAGQDHWEMETARAEGMAPDVRWHLRRDGGLVFIEGSVRALQDPGGRLRGFLKVGQDVTERRRADERLRTDEERFRAIVETARDYAIFTTDPRGAIETWPPGAEAVFGWTAAEAVGQMMDMTFTPEDRAAGAPEEERRTARETGQAPNVRWHLRRDGTRVFIDGITRPLRGEYGAVTGFVKVGQDVTDRRATEEALRESEARFRNMADHAPVMMWVTDAGGRCTYLNRAWYEFTGQSVEEAEGFGWLEATHPDDRAEAERVFLDANARGEPFRLEYRLRRHDGEFRWAIDAAAPRFDPGGEFGGYVGSVTDIHERKEAEVVLERRVAEAVAERATAEEQLRQSQKMEAMGQLTGGVAHDFNNLLTPIIGSLDRLVMRGLGSERERRLMAGALESAERAKTLVQRLLAFARRQPLQPVAVDVGVVVQGMAGLIGSTLGPAIDMRLDLAVDLPPARADANQLEMALLNLAVNARDAMPEGGTLTVAASRESVRAKMRTGSGPTAALRPGHYVRLSVADTGTGMDETTLARAIEPFFSTKGVGRGTGLGLSMVHGLAAQLGGGLTMDSEPGRGTTVALWLPLSVEPVGATDDDRAAPPSRSAARGRALLVDDEDLVRMSTADMLADLGFEVLEAGSGEDALLLLREDAVVDILVTDHLMPGMSGADLVREARTLRPGLPALIVSGYAEVEGLAPDLPRLVKPFRIADLAERVTILIPGG